MHHSASKVKSVFKKGAYEWQKDTCINFFEGNGTLHGGSLKHYLVRTLLAPERVEVIVESGCWSYVGNVHKKQPLSLGEGCESVMLNFTYQEAIALLRSTNFGVINACF